MYCRANGLSFWGIFASQQALWMNNTLAQWKIITGRYEKIFKEIIVENFPNMEKEIVNQVQETQRVPYRINPRRNIPRHILIKRTKTKHKEY